MPVLDDPRKEKFCQEIASGTSQARAYVLAGYGGPNPKPLQSASNASKMAGKEPCFSRIKELKQSLTVYKEKTKELTEKLAGNLSATEVARQFIIVQQMALLEACQNSGDLRGAQTCLDRIGMYAGFMQETPKAGVGRPRHVKSGDGPPTPKPTDGGAHALIDHDRNDERPAEHGDEEEISRISKLTEELDRAAGDAPAEATDAS